MMKNADRAGNRNQTFQYLEALIMIMVIDDHTGTTIGILSGIFPYNYFYTIILQRYDNLHNAECVEKALQLQELCVTLSEGNVKLVFKIVQYLFDKSVNFILYGLVFG